MATDYYKILGVGKDASKDEIKKAYKKLAKKHHPDVDKSADADEKFKKINEAYQALSDDKKRAAYDRFGNADFGGPSTGSGFGFGQDQNRSGNWGPFAYTYNTSGGAGDFGGIDPFDIFEEVFGFRGFGQQRRGRNLRYSITIDFMDAINGLTEEVNLGGKRLKVKIPAGIRDGGQIKFSGEGQPGPQGTPPGDLYLTVRIRPHPKFTRVGDDIYILKEISFVQAALGDTIKVETVERPVKLKIPAGTQSGTQFRLRGKGVPSLSSRRSLLGGRGRGDQYVRVRVKVPQNLSRKQRKLLEEFRDL